MVVLKVTGLVFAKGLSLDRDGQRLSKVRRQECAGACTIAAMYTTSFYALFADTILSCLRAKAEATDEYEAAADLHPLSSTHVTFRQL